MTCRDQHMNSLTSAADDKRYVCCRGSSQPGQVVLAIVWHLLSQRICCRLLIERLKLLGNGTAKKLTYHKIVFPEQPTLV